MKKLTVIMMKESSLLSTGVKGVVFFPENTQLIMDQKKSDLDHFNGRVLEKLKRPGICSLNFHDKKLLNINKDELSSPF